MTGTREKNRVDYVDAVVRFLEHTASQDDLPFIRTLDDRARIDAMQYLRGLIEHARRRRAVPNHRSESEAP